MFSSSGESILTFVQSIELLRILNEKTEKEIFSRKRR
jgi:hypothetical protein